MELEDYEHGLLVRDTVTGFKGTAVSLTDSMNGCLQVLIDGRWEKEGDKLPRILVDLQQVEICAVQDDDAKKNQKIAAPSAVKKRRMKKEKKGEKVRTGGPTQMLSRG